MAVERVTVRLRSCTAVHSEQVSNIAVAASAAAAGLFCCCSSTSAYCNEVAAARWLCQSRC
jgi:hypothetical protein